MQTIVVNISDGCQCSRNCLMLGQIIGPSSSVLMLTVGNVPRFLMGIEKQKQFLLGDAISN